MRIPGIPDEELERIHWWYGPGKGSAVAYRHVPSGIQVARERPPEAPLQRFDEELLAELTQALREHGLLPKEK